MSFNSYGGIIFAILVLCGYHLIRRHDRQNIFLLLVSIYFYATSSILFTGLLISTIYVGFSAGQIIESVRNTGRSVRTITAFAIILLLGILGVFKYYNFFVDSFAASISMFGFKPSVSTLNIVLPVGISFYIFQTIGYLIDVVRKQTKAETNLIDFALFVSFFPQLVAGPIERSQNFLKQIKVKRPPITNADVTYGLFLIIQGYAKKVVIADNLAPYVDAIFEHKDISSPLIWVGLLLFAIQIYGDFSGYTDIARGYSRLLGFRILLNFDRPYAARSPSDFWRRWHISLSNWFTEYVYFSLGGNRSKSSVRRGGNVLGTMTLSGLWHGASLNFIIWGAYHGLIILLGRVFSKIVPKAVRQSKASTALAVSLTFILMLYGWMYFRITDFDQLISFHHAIIFEWGGWEPALAFLFQGTIFLVLWLVIDIMELHWINIHAHEVKNYRGIGIYMGFILTIVFVLHAVDPSAFIYFRF
ncbi:MAG: MBOAT family protein [Hyphomonadaceae bacterium]|nr:MBOAT family protein [Hyphomonadaceae bacterium]